jgi:hypothetical protein
MFFSTRTEELKILDKEGTVYYSTNCLGGAPKLSLGTTVVQ